MAHVITRRRFVNACGAAAGFALLPPLAARSLPKPERGEALTLKRWEYVART